MGHGTGVAVRPPETLFHKLFACIWNDMVLYPNGEVFTVLCACCHFQNYCFLFLGGSLQFMPVQNRKRFHHSMSNTFVAVDKCVILDE